MGFLDSLFGNAKLGFQISNQVIKVLLKDRGLFVYPVVMALISFILLVIVFVPFILFGGLSFGFLSLMVLSVLYYFITAFIATYFLFALYIAFKSYVKGTKIGMFDALSQAGSRLPEIINWAIFYTVARTIIKLIEETFNRGVIGFLVQSIISIGLFLGMTFAVPIIFEDDVGPIEAVKRSAMFIINNLGKTFSGILYFDLIGFIIKIIGGVFIAGAIVAGLLDFFGISIVLGGFTIIGHTSLLAIGVIFLIGLGIYIVGDLFNYVTLHIYYLVIYEYVKYNKIPKGMDESLIKSSIMRGGAPSAGGKSGKGGGNQQSGGLFQTDGDA